jgi:hypothetical protein
MYGIVVSESVFIFRESHVLHYQAMLELDWMCVLGILLVFGCLVLRELCVAPAEFTSNTC